MRMRKRLMRLTDFSPELIKEIQQDLLNTYREPPKNKEVKK